MSLKWLTIGTLCCLIGYGLAIPLPQDAEGDAAKPAEGEEAKPAEGDAAKPAEGDAAKPAEGEASKPAEGDAAKPAEGDAAKPAEGEAAKPAEGDAAKPAEGEAAKPAEGDATKPAEGDAAKPAEGDTAKPAEGDANAGDAKLAGEEENTTANSGDAKLAGEDGAANTTAATSPAAEGEAKTTASVIVLNIEKGATIPGNVYTDKYGEPIKLTDMKNISLPGGGILNIMTEQWRTYYTQPAIIPGCECITRGPLTRFKLIGNLHFPKIKVTPERYVTLPTEPTSTLCPPCVCPTCPSGNEIEFT